MYIPRTPAPPQIEHPSGRAPLPSEQCVNTTAVQGRVHVHQKVNPLLYNNYYMKLYYYDYIRLYCRKMAG